MESDEEMIDQGAYNDGFVMLDGYAYCPYCGHKMMDMGDSWFCNSTDCINNTEHPKK
jgi:hypothetical protein